MEQKIDSSILKQYLESYEKIFDIVRIIDPVKRQLVEYKDNAFKLIDIPCFSLWHNNNFCENCITLKAYKEKNTLVKIKHKTDEVFIIFAMPLTVGDNPLVLELITYKNLLFESVEKGKGNEVKNIIQDFNNLIFKDDLTNIYNRRFIDKMLPEEIFKCSSDMPLSIAMIDIDFFKNVNDSYGHIVGDVVLRKFCKIVSKYIRSDSDWIARYGGEEFILCLPDTDNITAYKILERMRKAIAKTIIKVEDINIMITASFGLYTIEDNNLKALDLVKFADNKLYAAKKQGRNMVVK